MTACEYTPIQGRMMQVLGDGLIHHVSQLHACLEDDLGPWSNVNAHLTALRKKLRPTGQDIVCTRRLGFSYYRLVRLMASTYDGRT